MLSLKTALIEGLEGYDQIDDSGVFATREDVTRGLLENVLVLAGCPNGIDGQFPLFGAALRGNDRLMVNRAHLGAVFRLDGVGVVPEIEAVDIAVVEPEAGVMRMVDSFVWHAARVDSRA